jgi:glycosyltransferase involved in cell wall biosynthesis
LRVLILSQHFWPETFRITEVAESLAARGCQVAVLTGQPNYPDGKTYPGYRARSMKVERNGNVAVHRVPLVPRGNGSGLRLVLNYLSFIASACLLGPWLLRKQTFDVIFVYGTSPILQAIPAIWLRWLKKCALITWVQDLWPESLEDTGFVRNPRLLAAVAAVVRWIYQRNDLLLVQSRGFVEPVQQMASGTPVAYHPNPGERAFGQTEVPSEAPALRLGPGFNVVFAGNLGTVQALGTVLDAAELLRDHPEIRWTLIGSGSRSGWLRTEIDRRGLRNVSLPGRFDADAMPGILPQASVLLVSLIHSRIMSRTVPSKVQAYLAAGRPIVASLDGEGAKVIDESGAGLTCPVEDAQALASAVLRLHAMSREDLDRLGRAGRSFYHAHFDSETLTARLMELMRDTISKGRPGRPLSHSRQPGAKQ